MINYEVNQKINDDVYKIENITATELYCHMQNVSPLEHIFNSYYMYVHHVCCN